MTTFNLTQEQYTALITMAQRSLVRPDGSVEGQSASELQSFLLDIEKQNGIVRHSLWVRWQDPTMPLPAGWKANFPKTWPISLQFFLQLLSRPLCRADVMEVVNARTPNATNIMVTRDPGALVGWTQLDTFFP